MFFSCMQLMCPFIINCLLFFLQGYGTNFYSYNEYFEGEWYADNRSGWGRMYFSDGSVYEGEWYNNMRNGEGMLRLGKLVIHWCLVTGEPAWRGISFSLFFDWLCISIGWHELPVGHQFTIIMIYQFKFLSWFEWKFKLVFHFYGSLLAIISLLVPFTPWSDQQGIFTQYLYIFKQKGKRQSEKDQ